MIIMDNTKIEIKIGEIQFIGEGSPNWLEKQLDKILDKAESLSKLSNTISAKSTVGNVTPFEPRNNEIGNQTLATFLKSKTALSTQNDKFLATAIWLDAKGKDRLKTSDVSSVLKDAKQVKLGNAADCLNQNLSKGFCERDGKTFFVTEEGRKYFSKLSNESN
jgi:NADH pyrophosphatase NudC (nudix superfamily)